MHYNLLSQLSTFPEKQIVIVPELLIFLQIHGSFETCKSILFSAIHNSFHNELVRRSLKQKYFPILLSIESSQ